MAPWWLALVIPIWLERPWSYYSREISWSAENGSVYITQLPFNIFSLYHIGSWILGYEGNFKLMLPNRRWWYAWAVTFICLIPIIIRGAYYFQVTDEAESLANYFNTAPSLGTIILIEAIIAWLVITRLWNMFTSVTECLVDRLLFNGRFRGACFNIHFENVYDSNGETTANLCEKSLNEAQLLCRFVAGAEYSSRVQRQLVLKTTQGVEFAFIEKTP